MLFVLLNALIQSQIFLEVIPLGLCLINKREGDLAAFFLLVLEALIEFEEHVVGQWNLERRAIDVFHVVNDSDEVLLADGLVLIWLVLVDDWSSERIVYNKPT